MVRARPVSLSNIRLLGGPLKAAQDADAKYLLELEPDRMMAFYRVRAGPYATMQESQAVCARVKGTGFDCMAVSQ